jgi:hypothetical protein
MNAISRSEFLHKGAVGAAGILLLPSLLYAQASPTPKAQQQKGPPLDKELVKEFVTVAHKDFGKVKLMLAETPDLLNASHNWSNWDWEDAIGAAGHMGLRDMAMFLLDQGARPTIHVAAMLGKIDVVKAYIKAYPQMKDAVGPHKISLFRHAKAGGENAKEVLEYLAFIGAKE